MNDPEMDHLFHAYAQPVIARLRSYDLTVRFQDCTQLLADRIPKTPAWQISLPVIACLAAGGSLEDGSALATAWYPAYLSSEILDNVEDKEFIPDRSAPSPEVATNLATSLLFIAFHALTSIQDPEKACRVSRIFSQLGFEATLGQHRDLLKTPSTVETALHDYWEMIILKSGSVFRTATAGGAAAGTSDERTIEALGDYGTALGVMLQLCDDCRDIFTRSQDSIHLEISLPLLLYLMASGEDSICFPQVSSKVEWSDMLVKMGVTNTIAALLLEWKIKALESLEPIRTCREKLILESIPSHFLERLVQNPGQVLDGTSA